MFDLGATQLAEAPVSPLLLSDHLITLAERADRAGYQMAARRLVTLAHQVLDEPALWLPSPGH